MLYEGWSVVFPISICPLSGAGAVGPTIGSGSIVRDRLLSTDIEDVVGDGFKFWIYFVFLLVSISLWRSFLDEIYSRDGS